MINAREAKRLLNIRYGKSGERGVSEIKTIGLYTIIRFSSAVDRILNDNNYRLENSLLYSHRVFDEIEETILRIMRES